MRFCFVLGKKISEAVVRLGIVLIQMYRFCWVNSVAVKQPFVSTGCHSYVNQLLICYLCMAALATVSVFSSVGSNLSRSIMPCKSLAICL